MTDGSVPNRSSATSRLSHIRFGVAIPQASSRAAREEIADFGRTAEDAGFDALWLQHQVTGAGGLLDPIVAAAFVGATTESISIGVAVMVTAFYHPVVIANAILALDHLTQGRFVIGAGVGGLDHYSALGSPSTRRGDRFEDGIKVLMRLLEAEGLPISSSGLHRIREVVVTPPTFTKPRPPLLIGGSGRAAILRAARLGDGWIGAGATSSAGFRQQLGILDDALQRLGRGPEFARGKRVYLAIGPNRRMARLRLRDWFGLVYRQPELGDEVALVGSASECADGLAELISYGATFLILNPVYDERRHLDVLGAEILPMLSGSL